MDFDVEVFEEIPGAAKAMANDLKKALDFKKLSSDIRKSGSEISFLKNRFVAFKLCFSGTT